MQYDVAVAGAAASAAATSAEPIAAAAAAVGTIPVAAAAHVDDHGMRGRRKRRRAGLPALV